MTCLALAGKWRGTAPIEMFSRASKSVIATLPIPAPQDLRKLRRVDGQGFNIVLSTRSVEGNCIGLGFYSGVVSLQVVFSLFLGLMKDLSVVSSDEPSQ